MYLVIIESICPFNLKNPSNQGGRKHGSFYVKCTNLCTQVTQAVRHCKIPRPRCGIKGHLSITTNLRQVRFY